MDHALTALYEDSLKKAKQIYTVLGWLGVIASLLFFALLVVMPANGDSEAYAKLGMAVFTLVLAAGSAYRIRAGYRYEASVRETFAHPERVRRVTFGHVQQGPSITYAIHFDVGQKDPISLPVLNKPAFERMRPLIQRHFPHASS
jgi:hypothetical protein